MNTIPFFFNHCIDKGRLKRMILWSLTYQGEHKTLQLIENLKTLGFKYATYAGVSLSIDDLSIPPKKKAAVLEAEGLVAEGVQSTLRGDRSAIEGLQSVIDTWHRTSENVKDHVIDYFEATNILNPVYMMAFSGARGNVSQVRQLVGMRGLMADPNGNIIGYPIRSNFREGLTVTEYMISCYGARKGVVDTALRTADAGYLTRRLVDVAQHVVVQKGSCGTRRGIKIAALYDGRKKVISLAERLLGRVLSEDVVEGQQVIGLRNQAISESFALRLSELSEQTHLRVPLAITVRSPLTCELTNGVCQLCYGWSLAQSSLVTLGEAVGVIAGQSIGEPGTQLTMRTFHTGGVFTGDVQDEFRSPHQGVVHFPEKGQGGLVRTSYGQICFLVQRVAITLLLVDNQQQKQTRIQIPINTALFVREGELVQSNQLLGQFSDLDNQQDERVKTRKTVASLLDGEVVAEKMFFPKEGETEGKGPTIESEAEKPVVEETLGTIWVLAGKDLTRSLAEKNIQEDELVPLFKTSGQLVKYQSVLSKTLKVSDIDGFITYMPASGLKRHADQKLRRFPSSAVEGLPQRAQPSTVAPEPGMQVLRMPVFEATRTMFTPYHQGEVLSDGSQETFVLLDPSEYAPSSAPSKTFFPVSLLYCNDYFQTEGGGQLWSDSSLRSGENFQGFIFWTSYLEKKKNIEKRSGAFRKRSTQAFGGKDTQLNGIGSPKALSQSEAKKAEVYSYDPTFESIIALESKKRPRAVQGRIFVPLHHGHSKAEALSWRRKHDEPLRESVVAGNFGVSELVAHLGQSFLKPVQETLPVTQSPAFVLKSVKPRLRGLIWVQRNEPLYTMQTAQGNQKTYNATVSGLLHYEVQKRHKVRPQRTRVKVASRFAVRRPFANQLPFSLQPVSPLQGKLRIRLQPGWVFLPSLTSFTRKRSSTHYAPPTPGLPHFDGGRMTFTPFLLDTARKPQTYTSSPTHAQTSRKLYEWVSKKKESGASRVSILGRLRALACLRHPHLLNGAFLSTKEITNQVGFFSVFHYAQSPLYTLFAPSHLYRRTARLSFSEFTGWVYSSPDHRWSGEFPQGLVHVKEYTSGSISSYHLKSTFMVLYRSIHEYSLARVNTLKNTLQGYQSFEQKGYMDFRDISHRTGTLSPPWSKQMLLHDDSNLEQSETSVKTFRVSPRLVSMKNYEPSPTYILDFFVSLWVKGTRKRSKFAPRAPIGVYERPKLVYEAPWNPTTTQGLRWNLAFYRKPQGVVQGGLLGPLEGMILAGQHVFRQRVGVRAEGEVYTQGGKNLFVLRPTDVRAFKVPSSGTEGTPPYSISVGQVVRYGDEICPGVASPESGQVLSIEGSNFTLRKGQSILYYKKGTVRHVKDEQWLDFGQPVVTLTYQRLVTGDIVQGIPKVEQIFEGHVKGDLKQLLASTFEKLKKHQSCFLATRPSLNFIQKEIIERIQKIYLSQGVSISDKHFEIIVRQMTSAVKILDPGTTGLFLNEKVSLNRVENINMSISKKGRPAEYEPIITGISEMALNSNSFLSAASFQETTRILTRDSIYRKTDFLRGLKERVILGDLIPAGTGLPEVIAYRTAPSEPGDFCWEPSPMEFNEIFSNLENPAWEPIDKESSDKSPPSAREKVLALLLKKSSK